jgi:hypothetical protein
MTIPAERLESIGWGYVISRGLTKPGSDFSMALREHRASGSIAVCIEGGDVVGWARTEKWQDHDTLEAFVRDDRRRRGVARFCAAGLVASGLFASPTVAVFDPLMGVVATRVGLLPKQFRRAGEEWVPV